MSCNDTDLACHYLQKIIISPVTLPFEYSELEEWRPLGGYF